MSAQAQTGLKASVVIERLFHAPVADVWRAWTDPARLARWWGPDGYINPVCEIDPRVGGALRMVMRAPDGAEHPMTATILDIVEHRSIVWTVATFGTDGEKHLEGITTVTFADEGGKTRLIVQADAEGFTPQSRFMLGGMEAGWTQSIERLRALIDAEG